MGDGSDRVKTPGGISAGHATENSWEASFCLPRGKGKKVQEEAMKRRGNTKEREDR